MKTKQHLDENFVVGAVAVAVAVAAAVLDIQYCWSKAAVKWSTMIERLVSSSSSASGFIGTLTIHLSTRSRMVALVAGFGTLRRKNSMHCIRICRIQFGWHTLNGWLK